MKIIYTLVFTLAVIPNFTECSSQSDKHPDKESDPGPPSSLSSASRQLSPDQTSHVELPLRERSRSPPGKPPTLEVLGYPLAQLGYLRLIPYANQSIRFEFRKYDIPAHAPIRVRAVNKRYIPVPPQEYIVLSAPNGDIYAILEHSGVLRGIYRTNSNRSRAKINMRSGAIVNMTHYEMEICPVGEKYPIFPHTFVRDVADYDTLQNRHRGPTPHPAGPQHSADRIPRRAFSIRARSVSPPGWDPSQQVLGYSLEKLGYIRLIPSMNPTQRFEFRRYVFPINKPIRWIDGKGRRLPLLDREHIVLSTSNGDIHAILEQTGLLRPMYRSDRSHSRVKVNMISGAVVDMTADERLECAVGRKNPIFPHCFSEVLGNNDSLETLYH